MVFERSTYGTSSTWLQNPTSTAIFKALLSLKTRNALVR